MGYTCKEPRLLEEVTYTSNNKDIVERGKGQLTGYILIYMQRLLSFIHKKGFVLALPSLLLGPSKWHTA